MTLNKRLIEYRKGYKHWLKTAYKLSGFYIAIIYEAERFFLAAERFFLALARLLLAVFFAFTWPLWFIPASYIDYKLEYKRLKKRFNDFHVELTDDYRPKEKPESEAT